MKTVKKRTVSIIHELIGNEELMTLSELAEKFEVSQRTIRNDLKLINELLKEMDLGKIRLVGGRIICPSSFGQVLKAFRKMIYIHTSFHRRNVSKLQPLF